jgi:hypothetical protein
MERCTIHTGHTIAHSPSGLLGQGPARWPKPTAYGQPTTHEVRPVRNQRIVRGHCGQVRPAPPAWCGVLWHVEGYRGQGLRQILPRYSGYMPQHGDQDEAAEKGVLTGEAVGAVATDGIEGGNDSQVGEGARSSAS